MVVCRYRKIADKYRAAFSYLFLRATNILHFKPKKKTSMAAPTPHCSSTPFSRPPLGFRGLPPATLTRYSNQISGHAQFSPAPPPPRALTAIQNSGVIACLRAESGELAMEAARAALKGGISVLEIVVSTPGVFEVIQGLVKDYPASVIGAGTVLNVRDARNAIKAGAMFLMSPATVKEILDDLRGSQVLYLPGVMTPAEVLSAFSAGAKIVKVYPVSALTGPQYISAIKKPFSHIPMVASQGITIDLIRPYINQGASAVVLSDAIFDKEAMKQRNFDAIYELAKLATLLGDEAVRRKNLAHA